jgi:type IV secretion system protein VirD4
LNKNYFPRGNADWKEEHEPIATAQWTSIDSTIERFSHSEDHINPLLFGKLVGSDGVERLLSHNDDAHIVTVAGSRAGKGVSLIAPNLLNYRGSAIVVDLKGENANITAQWRSEVLKQEVIVLDPFGETNFNSQSFNPLLFLNPDDKSFIDDITDLAEALVVRGNAKESYWDDAARSVIKMILIYIIMDHDLEDRNLWWLRELILVGQSKSERPDYQPPVFKKDASLSEEENDEAREDVRTQTLKDNENSFLQFLKNLSNHDHPFVKGTAQRLLQAGDNERGSIISTTQRNTEFLDSKCVSDTLKKNDFDLSSLRKGASIYLVLPELRLAGQSRWLRLLLTVFLRHLQIEKKQNKDDPSVLVILDEFAAMGYMQVIERAAGYIAGFGVRLWSVLQDLSQLKDVYPNRWETFIGNSGIYTAFGNVDLTTQEYTSKRLGKCETPRIEESYSGGSSHNENRAGFDQMAKSPLAAIDTGGSEGSSETYNRKPAHVISPLLLPEEVGRYFGKNTGKVLVLFGQGQPVFADRIIYFEDEPFKSRAEKNPLHDR